MNDFYQNVVMCGLTSFSIAVPTTGPYFVDGKITIPTLVGGSPTPSALVTVINVNGSPVYTGIAGADGFRTSFPCTAADIIQIVFTSANAVDAGLNAVKAVIAIGQGV